MPTPPTPSSPERPTVDEWGLYDPERAGLVALYTRLAGRPSPPSAGAGQPGRNNPAPPLPRKPKDR